MSQDLQQRIAELEAKLDFAKGPWKAGAPHPADGTLCVILTRWASNHRMEVIYREFGWHAMVATQSIVIPLQDARAWREYESPRDDTPFDIESLG